MEFTLKTNQTYQTLRGAVKAAKHGETILFPWDDCAQIRVGRDLSIFSSTEEDPRSIRKDEEVIYTGPCERWELSPTDTLVIQSAGELLVFDPNNPEEKAKVVYRGRIHDFEVHRDGLLIYFEREICFCRVIW
jgi:hypothetical protein